RPNARWSESSAATQFVRHERPLLRRISPLICRHWRAAVGDARIGRLRRFYRLGFLGGDVRDFFHVARHERARVLARALRGPARPSEHLARRWNRATIGPTATRAADLPGRTSKRSHLLAPSTISRPNQQSDRASRPRRARAAATG